MSNDAIFDDPTARRRWLLGKALESVPLKEALTLAQQAERFLNAPLVASEGELDAGKLSEAPYRVALSEPAPQSTSSVRAQISDSTPGVTPSSTLPEDPTATAEAAGEEPDPVSASAGNGVSLVAGPDDVVRYLRQQGDIVISAPGGTYLVNGRFRDSLGELVKRANRIRARGRLPLFALMPLATVNGHLRSDEARPGSVE